MQWHFVLGQTVLHRVFNKSGRITDMDERRKRVRLDLNGVSLWAEMKDLRASTQPGQPIPSGAKDVTRSASDSFSLRLDLRGMRAEQALAEVERFLDKALLDGASEVEVIHGRGTGVLRRQVHDMLRANTAVERFALAPEDRGGDGMTIVSLR